MKQDAGHVLYGDKSLPENEVGSIDSSGITPPGRIRDNRDLKVGREDVVRDSYLKERALDHKKIFNNSAKLNKYNITINERASIVTQNLPPLENVRDDCEKFDDLL